MKYFYCDSYFYLVIEIYQLLELMLVKNSSEQKIVLKSWKNCIKVLEFLASKTRTNPASPIIYSHHYFSYII